MKTLPPSALDVCRDAQISVGIRRRQLGSPWHQSCSVVDPFFVHKCLHGRPVGANPEFEQQIVWRSPADANETTVVEQFQVMRVAEEREIPFIVGASA